MEHENYQFSSQEIDESPSTSEFIKQEDVEIIKLKKDYSNIYELPSLRTRFFSLLIDGLSIIILAYMFTLVFEMIGQVPDYMRKVVFLFCFVFYEPILVSTGSTIGQLFMNIQVKSFSNPEKKLNILNSLIRTLIKFLLGWLSFITVTFNPNRRAIHDFASGSIMITKTRSNNSLSQTLP